MIDPHKMVDQVHAGKLRLVSLLVGLALGAVAGVAGDRYVNESYERVTKEQLGDVRGRLAETLATNTQLRSELATQQARLMELQQAVPAKNDCSALHVLIEQKDKAIIAQRERVAQASPARTPDAFARNTPDYLYEEAKTDMVNLKEQKRELEAQFATCLSDAYPTPSAKAQP